MVCTRCGIIGADARPNWKEQAQLFTYLKAGKKRLKFPDEPTWSELWLPEPTKCRPHIIFCRPYHTAVQRPAISMPIAASATSNKKKPRPARRGKVEVVRV
jgi:hypothetical protein